MENSTAIPNGSLPEMVTYGMVQSFNQSNEFAGLGVPVIQTYALVISAFILAITAIIGLLSSSVVLTALTIGHLLKHYHYILLASLLIISILFNVVWSPLEIVCLLMYQSNNNLFLAIKDSAHSLYFMLLIMIGGVLGLLLLRFLFCFHSYTKRWSKYLAIIGLPFIVLLGIGLATLYGLMSLAHESPYRDQLFYHLLNRESYIVKLISLTIVIGSLFIGIMILLALRMSQLTFQLSTESITSISDHSITLPTLTPSDSGSEYKEFKPKPKPKESKGQLLVNNIVPGAKSEQGPLKKNSFAIHSTALMQMFGRRRHTISNIGEIDNSFTDHQRQAQGYQYVRKFSVDITALQAQLEDPKSHSSMSSFKSAEDMPQSNASFSMMPITKKGCSIEEPSTSRPLKKSSAPPRIMVEPVLEEEFHQTIEQKISEERQTHSNFRLCLLLLITFIMSVIPMYITESIRSLVTLDSYINSLICVTAVSSIQTVIFPHIIICTDTSVYKVLRNLITKCCVPTTDNKEQKESQSMLPQPSDYSISQL